MPHAEAALPATDGSTGYVVRNDKIVAHLVFFLKDGLLRARVTDTIPGAAALKAFDAIVVDAAVPAPSGSAPAPSIPSAGTAAPAQAAPNGSAPGPVQ